MEWLHLLVAHPSALESFQRWLDERIAHCERQALDVDVADIPKLQGTRTAYREIQAYIINNATLSRRALTPVELIDTAAFLRH